MHRTESRLTMQSAPLICLNLCPFQLLAFLSTQQQKHASRSHADSCSLWIRDLQPHWAPVRWEETFRSLVYILTLAMVCVTTRTEEKGSSSRRDLVGEGRDAQEYRARAGCWQTNCQVLLSIKRYFSQLSSCLMHNVLLWDSLGSF